ncbi:olfactory marker protein [Physeter macrocephalus]|uniref:Olfactory marker protein n=1 Tax=Physeter macrocephalus TaxID=9755 RepID=A0A9W2X831_PHYMC|nr:olfactory marker protein [Physeter catodon]
MRSVETPLTAAQETPAGGLQPLLMLSPVSACPPPPALLLPPAWLPQQLVPEEPATLLPACSASITASARSRERGVWGRPPSCTPHFEDGVGLGRASGKEGRDDEGGERGGGAPLWWPLALAVRPQSTRRLDGGGGSSKQAVAEDEPKPTQLDTPLVLDEDLTQQMRLRLESLKQRGGKRQDGEKLLQPAESVYLIDFIQQQRLQFERWDVVLDKPGKVTITGTSQIWTPDLTNLTTRQLLDPAAILWREEGSEAMDGNEADALEFGERLSELAKIRRVMYFLITFSEGVEPANLKASVVFSQL